MRPHFRLYLAAVPLAALLSACSDATSDAPPR